MSIIGRSKGCIHITAACFVSTSMYTYTGVIFSEKNFSSIGYLKLFFNIDITRCLVRQGLMMDKLVPEHLIIQELKVIVYSVFIVMLNPRKCCSSFRHLKSLQKLQTQTKISLVKEVNVHKCVCLWPKLSSLNNEKAAFQACLRTSTFPAKCRQKVNNHCFFPLQLGLLQILTMH